MICVSIGRSRHKMMIAEHKALAESGARLVEFRADYITGPINAARLLKNKPTPVVFTIRRKSDRGMWSGTEEQRQLALRSAILAGVDYIDIEDDIASGIRRYGETKRIISHHNFEETPDNLEEIHGRMRELDPDIIKLVTTANCPSDCVRMLELVQQSDIPTAGFCMGEFGLLSRVLCGRFGSPFTYATFHKNRAMAPGQLTFDEMRSLYRYESITAETNICAVLGDPIGHSLSPLIHNAAFQEVEADAVYVPIRIARDKFAAELSALNRLGINGYSVTIPHKIAAMEFASESDSLVEAIGAANTLVKTDEKWIARNTDCDAAVESIRGGYREVDRSDDLSNKHALILGAGGVARAIGAGLIKAGCRVTITSRTASKAQALASDLDCRTIPWDQRAAEKFDLLVNGTPVGMHPDVDETPFPGNWLNEGTLVFDTIYNPEQTLLIKDARDRNCLTVGGIEMFVRQAATQFEMFTEQNAPIDLMRQTIRDYFSPTS